VFITFLVWYQEHFKMHNDFLGQFSEHESFFTINDCFSLSEGAKWKSKDGNIPDFPALLIIPVNLVAQLTSELHVYFQHGTVDILSCLCT